MNPLYADSMDSSNFRIESAGIHDAAGNKSSDGYKLSDTVGQLAAGEFASSGYIVKAGFQYMHSIIPFRFSLSNIKIDFGETTADIEQTDSTTLTVSFGGAGQYQVTAAELGPLASLSTPNSIPDTACNEGLETCTEYSAKPWTLAGKYGFGYNMTGQDIPVDFTNNTYYRPFADKNDSETPAVVMTSANVGKNRQSTMTYKLLVGPLQAAGTYQTIINFVATPSY